MSFRSYSELDEESPAGRAAAAAEALFEAHQDEQRRQRTARVDALERRIARLESAAEHPRNGRRRRASSTPSLLQHSDLVTEQRRALLRALVTPTTSPPPAPSTPLSLLPLAHSIDSLASFRRPPSSDAALQHPSQAGAAPTARRHAVTGPYHAPASSRRASLAVVNSGGEYSFGPPGREDGVPSISTTRAQTYPPPSVSSHHTFPSTSAHPFSWHSHPPPSGLHRDAPHPPYTSHHRPPYPAPAPSLPPSPRHHHPPAPTGHRPAPPRQWMQHDLYRSSQGYSNTQGPEQEPYSSMGEQVVAAGISALPSASMGGEERWQGAQGWELGFAGGEGAVWDPTYEELVARRGHAGGSAPKPG